MVGEHPIALHSEAVCQVPESGGEEGMPSEQHVTPRMWRERVTFTQGVPIIQVGMCHLLNPSGVWESGSLRSVNFLRKMEIIGPWGMAVSGLESPGRLSVGVWVGGSASPNPEGHLEAQRGLVICWSPGQSQHPAFSSPNNLFTHFFIHRQVPAYSSCCL